MEEYLALPDGAGRFTQGFSGPALLRVPLPRPHTSPTGLSPAAAGLSRPFDSRVGSDIVALQPRCVRKRTGLGWSAFARHYLRNHFCFLFLGLLRCFSSARSPPDLRQVLGVAPFGNLWISAFVRLPTAYRSFTRPSSPLHAKASAVCPS
jgi:hypothetical protein